MPRPHKCRRICQFPSITRFIPGDSPIRGKITLTMDEYEAVRLIDLKHLTQAQCAAQMGVARTTVTSIYESARYKLSDMLVNGKQLVIEGGKVELCRHRSHCCGKGCQNDCFSSSNNKCEKTAKGDVNYENRSNL